MQSQLGKALIIVLMFCIPFASWGQEHHDHSMNELGISAGAIYSMEHKEWGAGLHIHYFRMLSPHSNWAIGISAEEVFADDNHYNISAGVKYILFDRLNIVLMPGITFLKHDGSKQTRFALHTEVVYDLFHFNKFHLGPAVDYSWTKDDSHFMLGLHFAFCF